MEDLGDLTVTVAPDVTDERFHTPGDPDPRIVLLRQGGGLRRVAQVDGDLAGLVGACDGELTVGQITAGLAVLGDEAVGDVRTRLYPASGRSWRTASSSCPDPASPPAGRGTDRWPLAVVTGSEGPTTGPPAPRGGDGG